MSSAGAVTYSEAFNLDTTDATFPYDCVVTVTDRYGLSATTTLQLEVQVTISTTYRRFLTPLQQTTFKNIVGKGNIDQLYSSIIFVDICLHRCFFQNRLQICCIWETFKQHLCYKSYPHHSLKLCSAREKGSTINSETLFPRRSG